jgi:hypothetical protein
MEFLLALAAHWVYIHTVSQKYLHAIYYHVDFKIAKLNGHETPT